MRPFLLLILLAVSIQAKEGTVLPPRTSAEILKTVTLPKGYSATVFAQPPFAGYPTSVSAAVDGTLFVAIDQNGSLGRGRNTKDKPIGRVVRLRDTDGDGVADEIKTFCEVESPRGVIWDGADGTGPGTLYVMHPPNLTAYTDTDGDGVADRQEDLVTGLGFTLDFRGADHTTNGCRLGIDGYIYIAMGDYGAVEAKGKDGRTLKHRGGGIVRVRPDGTGLELVTEGTRNIYDVAVSPTLDLFTRDNTNDGGGWDVRLNHDLPGAHMGYPIYFVNFPEDHLPPLADYGGGSPCGALWLDEPGMQNGLYTVEWGGSAVFYHPTRRKGATYELTGPNKGEASWLTLVRPTDLDVDASGRLYLSSWEGATFAYNGPNAGYVLRVTRNGAQPAPVPHLAQLGPQELGALIGSPSATLRLAAQREIVRRAARDPQTVIPFPKFSEAGTPTPVVYASINTTFEVLRVKGILPPEFERSLDDPEAGANLDEEAIVAGLQAVGSHPELIQQRPLRSVQAALRAPSPRVRTAALTALRRLGRTEAANDMIPLLADPDPVIPHLATRALAQLRAVEPLLGALDSADEKIKPAALRALYAIDEPAVVDGLIARLPGASGEYRHGLLNALCRLYHQDAPYADPKEWWGTRPDTSGPVYKPQRWAESDKIEAVLKKESDSASGDEGQWLASRLYLTKVNFAGMIEKLLETTGNNGAQRLKVIAGLFGTDNSLPAEVLARLVATVGDPKEAPEIRAGAIRLLQRASASLTGFEAVLAALGPLAGHDLPDPALTSAFEDATRDAQNAKWVVELRKVLETGDVTTKPLAATILVNLAVGQVGTPSDRKKAASNLNKVMEQADAAAAILGAIARAGARPLEGLVRAKLNDPNNAVAETALFAYQKLGLQEGAPAEKLIGAMTYEAVAAAVAKGGDPKIGQEMYLRAGCIACHTVQPNEPPKGPILSAVVKIYDRAALIESILKPSAKIAQGFESQWFKNKKDETVEGFVTREGGDSVDVRNILGQTVTLEKADIAERGQRDKSIMPEGLMAGFTPKEMCNLLAWLESLKN